MNNQFYVTNESMFVCGSSHGNQVKWVVNNMFCKADCAGYEGLAEAFVSRFFEASGLQMYFVRYYTANFYDVQTQDFKGRGCVCENYNPKLYVEIDLKHLLLQYGLLEQATQVAGLARFNIFSQILQPYLLSYLVMLTMLDTLILNDDRHFMNVRFFVTPTGLQPVPIFDNGAALFSDEGMYSFKKTLFENRGICGSALWGTNYEETLCMLQNLKAMPIPLNEALIMQFLNSFIDNIYKPIEVQRCKDVLSLQLRETRGLLWCPK